MKQLITILALTLALVSCGDVDFDHAYPVTDAGGAVPCTGRLFTFEYDGCEYIWYDCWNGDGNNSGMTHKGNCKNREHGTSNL